MDTVDRPKFPSIGDAMLVAAGYAISFALPKIGLLEAALTVVRNGWAWWEMGWDCVLEALILGPTAAGPVILAVHRRKPPRWDLRSGTALWGGLGVVKWLQIGLFYSFYGSRTFICVRGFEFLGATYTLWTVATVLRRGRRGDSWTEIMGMALGLAWSVHYCFNIYKSIFKGQMTTL